MGIKLTKYIENALSPGIIINADKRPEGGDYDFMRNMILG